MIRGIKVVQISLILAISFLIAILPVHQHYCTLADADLFPTDLSIENPDQEDLWIDRQENTGMFASYVLSIVLPSVDSALNPFPSFFFQAPSFSQRRFILRC